MDAMSRPLWRIWTTSFVTLLVAWTVQGIAIGPAQAQATQNFTCRQLDPTLGGAPALNTANTVNLTVANGDVITINSIGGSVDFTPPGGVFTTVATPAIFNIGPTQVGVWMIESGVTISCRTALTPPVKRDTTDGLTSTFMRVGGSILPYVVFPEPVVQTYKPATDKPLKFAPQVATSDPFYEKFGFARQSQNAPVLGADTASESLRFSLDLRSIAAKAAQKKKAAGYDTMTGEPAYHSRWNSWVTGRYVSFDDGNDTADRDGHLWWVSSGISYRVGEHTTVGVFSRIRMGEVRSSALLAALDSDFYGGGAYVATRLAMGLGLTAAVLYEDGDNDISIQDQKGSFDSDQWTVEGRIDKRFERGRHWFEPGVNLLYTRVDRDGYTDSVGDVVAGSELELGRLTYGPKFGTTIQGRNGEIKPFMHVQGVWDFVNEGDFQLAAGAVLSDADTALNLGGGVEFAFRNGALLTLGGDWFGFDDALDAWSVKGSADIPLAALGLGSASYAGRIGLDLASSANDQSAKARVRLPLN